MRPILRILTEIDLGATPIWEDTRPTMFRLVFCPRPLSMEQFYPRPVRETRLQCLPLTIRTHPQVGVAIITFLIILPHPFPQPLRVGVALLPLSTPTFKKTGKGTTWCIYQVTLVNSFLKIFFREINFCLDFSGNPSFNAHFSLVAPSQNPDAPPPAHNEAPPTEVVHETVSSAPNWQTASWIATQSGHHIEQHYGFATPSDAEMALNNSGTKLKSIKGSSVSIFPILKKLLPLNHVSHKSH